MAMAPSDVHHTDHKPTGPFLNDLTPQDFLPIRALGHGDIGTVFLVQLCRNNQSYAMKVMQKEVLQRKGEKRATTEKKVLSMVSHPFLPTLHAHFQSEKHIFFVMDFCSGGDLNVLRQKQPTKRFSESVTRFYAAEVVVALEYLHCHGIIYRDLKPENILIQSSGHIMLSDFDLSLVVDSKPLELPQTKKRSLGAIFSCFSPNSVATSTDEMLESRRARSPIPFEDAVTACKLFPFYGWQKSKSKNGQVALCRSHSFVGTEEYVAPEVLWGKGHGFSVDWWTLGIFLYEMVYAKTPFKGMNRKETFYNILCKEPEFSCHSPINDLIRRLLVKEPESRLGSRYGAGEIKKHPYFRGTAWKHLEQVTRPPFVPPPPQSVEIKVRKLGDCNDIEDCVQSRPHVASGQNTKKPQENDTQDAAQTKTAVECGSSNVEIKKEDVPKPIGSSRDNNAESSCEDNKNKSEHNHENKDIKVLDDQKENSQKQPELTNDHKESSQKHPEIRNDQKENSLKQPELTNDKKESSQQQPELTNDKKESSQKQPELTNDQKENSHNQTEFTNKEEPSQSHDKEKCQNKSNCVSYQINKPFESMAVAKPLCQGSENAMKENVIMNSPVKSRKAP